MGFLSDSAKKAYKRGSKRAYVPEWFIPAAYVFAGIAAVALLVTALTAGDPVAYVVPDDATSTGATPVTVGTTPIGMDNENMQDVADDMLVVEYLDGGSARAPRAMMEQAESAARALFTGKFSDVIIYPGQNTPVVLSVWEEPDFLGVVSVKQFPSGEWQSTFRVDPDGDGLQAERDISVLVLKYEDQWAYLPG
jgi:hypothetical protein